MKIVISIIGILVMASCNNGGNSTKNSDSTAINTKTNNPADGGPNNGLGDTTTYNRSNDTVTHDTIPKK